LTEVLSNCAHLGTVFLVGEAGVRNDEVFVMMRFSRARLLYASVL